MKQAKELYEALRNVANSGADILPAIVKDVDKTEGTCTVEWDGLEIGGVQLQSIVKNGVKGFKRFPAIDSVVLIKRINAETYLVNMYSDIEESVFEVGDKVYKINATGHLISAGADTLKQVLSLIIEAVEKIVVLEGNNPDYVKLLQATAKLNNILV